MTTPSEQTSGGAGLVGLVDQIVKAGSATSPLLSELSTRLRTVDDPEVALMIMGELMERTASMGKGQAELAITLARLIPELHEKAIQESSRIAEADLQVTKYRQEIAALEHLAPVRAEVDIIQAQTAVVESTKELALAEASLDFESQLDQLNKADLLDQSLNKAIRSKLETLDAIRKAEVADEANEIDTAKMALQNEIDRDFLAKERQLRYREAQQDFRKRAIKLNRNDLLLAIQEKLIVSSLIVLSFAFVLLILAITLII